MDKNLKIQLLDYLSQFITDNRWQKIETVLQQRTRYLTVVLEDIYQPHNASAVLRSCEAFGIQDQHVIENRNEFDPNKGVTIGAHKWLTTHHYRKKGAKNTRECYAKLRDNGYNIIATTPHHQDVTIEEISVDEPTALVFGAELEGLSDVAMSEADGYARIPMSGFSESFNISVGAALCLYELAGRMRRQHQDWMLSDSEKLNLKLEWVKKSLRAADEIEQRFLEQQK